MSLSVVFLCRLPTASPPPPQSYLVSGVLSAAAGGYVAATSEMKGGSGSDGFA